jgi:hypothetical protein
MGGLAANLARIKSFSENDDNAVVVYHLLEESKFYIEWAGLEMETSKASDIVELQRRISIWQLRFDEVWKDKTRRRMLARFSAHWSSVVLKNSGLLEK